MKNSNLIKPFKYQNFRLLISSEMVYRSTVWMTSLIFALMMQTIHPGSTFYQGLIGFLYGIPAFLLSPFAGVFADRFQRLHILRSMQAAMAFLFLLVIIGLLTHINKMTLIVLATLLNGVLFAITIPALQAFVVNTIPDKSEIGAGVSVFNSLNRAWQFLGFGLGGLLYTLLGAVFCFILTVLSNVAALILLFKINVKEVKPPLKSRPLQDFKTGLHYIYSHFNVCLVIMMITLNGFFVFSYIFQMTIVNADYLHGTDQTLGFLLGIGGIGALCSGLFITLRNNTLYLTYFMRAAILIIVVSYLVLSFLHSVLPAYPTIFMLDFSLSLLITCGAIFLQQICPEETRGRVTGIFTMVNIGMIPLGNLLYYGLLGELFGPMVMFRISSLIMLVFFIYFSLNLSKLRRLTITRYIENGLLTDDCEVNKI